MKQSIFDLVSSHKVYHTKFTSWGYGRPTIIFASTHAHVVQFPWPMYKMYSCAIVNILFTWQENTAGIYNNVCDFSSTVYTWRIWYMTLTYNVLYFVYAPIVVWKNIWQKCSWYYYLTAPVCFGKLFLADTM